MSVNLSDNGAPRHKNLFGKDLNRLMPAMGRLWLALGLCALLFGMAAAHGAVLLVRQDGSGNYTTIQACVNAMAPGDTCLVGPGVYPERVRFPSGKSGQAGRLTTVKAETKGTVDTWGFNTANCSYVRVEGFNITTSLSGIADGSGITILSSNVQVVSNYVHDVHYFGIYITGTSNYVAGNHIFQSGSGINITGTGTLVEGNEVERLIKYSEMDDADYSRFFGSYHVIRGNYFHGTQQSEIGDAHVDGFQTFDQGGTAQHIRIEGNRVYDFFHQGFMMEATVYTNSFDILICNNIIRGANSWGLDATRGIRDVRVYNNTFVDSAGIGMDVQATGQIRNNIFYNVTWFSVDMANVTGGNNLFYRPGGSVSGLFAGDLVNQDPKLVDVANYDFHLRTGSPAIDRGAALSEVSADFTGLPRPQGAGWDLGAFEFGSVSSDTNPPVISALGVSPLGAYAATVNWTTDENANGWVEYGLTTAYGSAVTNVSLVPNHQINLSGLAAGSTYHYRVRSTDAAGNTGTSGDFTFQTLAGTVFTSQPQSRTNTAGSTASFSASASGTAPLSYQWYQNGSTLINGSQVTGVTSNDLSISNAQLADAGLYSLVVSNAAGSITSSVATLTVVYPPGNCVTPPAGLVGWWPGDANGNNLAGGSAASLQGGATAGAAGVVAQAFSFNGSSSYVQIPDAPALHPTNFTIEAWVRFDSLDSTGSGGSPAGDQYVVFKQNSSSSEFEGFDLRKMRVSGGDVFTLLVSSAASQSAQATSSTWIFPGVWYHVAAVRGSNFLQLYVNGQLEGQASVSFPQDYGNLPLYFGTSGQSYWDHKLAGSLDEVSLYDRALSPSEIAAVYTAGATGKCKESAEQNRLTSSLKQGTNFTFNFLGQTGRTYSIEMSTGLLNWSSVTNVTLTNGTAQISRPMTGPRQFYRTKLLP